MLVPIPEEDDNEYFGGDLNVINETNNNRRKNDKLKSINEKRNIIEYFSIKRC